MLSFTRPRFRRLKMQHRKRWSAEVFGCAQKQTRPFNCTWKNSLMVGSWCNSVLKDQSSLHSRSFEGNLRDDIQSDRRFERAIRNRLLYYSSTGSDQPTSLCESVLQSSSAHMPRSSTPLLSFTVRQPFRYSSRISLSRSHSLQPRSSNPAGLFSVRNVARSFPGSQHGRETRPSQRLATDVDQSVSTLRETQRLPFAARRTRSTTAPQWKTQPTSIQFRVRCSQATHPSPDVRSLLGRKPSTRTKRSTTSSSIHSHSTTCRITSNNTSLSISTAHW